MQHATKNRIFSIAYRAKGGGHVSYLLLKFPRICHLRQSHRWSLLLSHRQFFRQTFGWHFSGDHLSALSRPLVDMESVSIVNNAIEMETMSSTERMRSILLATFDCMFRHAKYRWHPFGPIPFPIVAPNIRKQWEEKNHMKTTLIVSIFTYLLVCYRPLDYLRSAYLSVRSKYGTWIHDTKSTSLQLIVPNNFNQISSITGTKK